MDLGAYMQIDDLEQIAKDNGIEIPRLRGYRLMSEESPIPAEDTKKRKKECAIGVAEDLCAAYPFWSLNPEWLSWNDHTERLQEYYLVKGKDEDGNESFVDIRWDRIHGKKRKTLKYAIKKKQREIQAQDDAWNQYAGKEGVLYIHSRMGGGNWAAFEDKDSIVKQPWFLERVDDCYDCTYCDFYAKIK